MERVKNRLVELEIGIWDIFKKDGHFSFHKESNGDLEFIKKEFGPNKYGKIKFISDTELKFIMKDSNEIVCKYGLTNDQFHFWNDDGKIDFILRKRNN